MLYRDVGFSSYRNMIGYTFFLKTMFP